MNNLFDTIELTEHDAKQAALDSHESNYAQVLDELRDELRKLYRYLR